MEQIYPATHFDCTEKLSNLNEYLKSYADQRRFFTENETLWSKEELIRMKLNELMDCKDVDWVAKNCSPDLLSVEGEILPLDVYTASRYTLQLHRYDLPEAGNNLETIKAKMQYDKIEPNRKEFDNIPLKPESQPGDRDVSLDDGLVLVRVYQPYAAGHKKLRKVERLKCSHEIVALMSNKLSELRDKILCANDNGLSLEIDDLKLTSIQNVKGEYPSGLIGIDDVLYIDMREPNAVDYSKVITEWGRNKNIANFKVLHMDKVQMKDLTFRLGYPYIYQHRGNCEHVFVFSDVRLIKRSDPLTSRSYPFYHSINRYNIEQCNICHSATAKWVVCECDRLPHDRTFLCQDCFVSYNYLDDKKIGSFKAYPYYDKSSVMKEGIRYFDD